MFEKPVITSGLGNNTAQTHKQQDVQSVERGRGKWRRTSKPGQRDGGESREEEDREQNKNLK